MGPEASLLVLQFTNVKHSNLTKGRTQRRELPLCAGSGEGCQWQALPSPLQCEETATRTQDLPVTGGKTLPLALGPPFTFQLLYGMKMYVRCLLQQQFLQLVKFVMVKDY